MLKCHWCLEQGDGISITQRVHYEWIMHCATSLDMQQSECQNSFQHTFFSSCSRISCLNKDTRNPIFCSFLHYDDTTETAPKEGEANARNPDIDHSRQSAWQAHHRVMGGVEPTSIWIRWKAGKKSCPSHSKHTDKETHCQKTENRTTTKILNQITDFVSAITNIVYAQSLKPTMQVFLLTHEVTTSSMQRNLLI